MPRPIFAFSCIAVITAAVALHASQTTMIGRSVGPNASSADVLVVQQVNLNTGQSFGTMPTHYVVEAHQRLAGIADLAIVGWAGESIRLANRTGPSDLAVARATFNTLAVLGIRPALGRDFTEADVQEGRRVAILTAGPWQRLFGSRPDVLGTTVWWTGHGQSPEPVEIIGVLPAGTLTVTPELDPRTEALVLLDHRFPNAVPGDRCPAGILRLRPGASLATAQRLLDESIAAARLQLRPESQPFGARLSTLRPK